MKKTERKVLLFIVEGTSDKVSFQGILENFFNRFAIKIAVMYCDITAENLPNPGEIKEILAGRLKDFCSREKLFVSDDIQKIVHLIDTDGAFIPDLHIKNKQSKGIEYTDSEILTTNPEYIKKRNSCKSSVVSRLCSMEKLCGIEYKLFYFSRNLEHVLHNNPSNLTDREKAELSEAFDDKYADDIQGFLKFIKSTEFAVQGDYKFSWDFIRQGLNSLERHSNFHLLFQ